MSCTAVKDGQFGELLGRRADHTIALSLNGNDPVGPPHSDYWDGHSWAPAASTPQPPAEPAQHVSGHLTAHSPPAYPRWMVALMAAGMVIVLAAVATIGALALNQGSGPLASSLATTAGTNPPPPNPAGKPAAPAPTKRPAAPPVRELTATPGGQYCPGAYVNQNTCWHGTPCNPRPP